MTNYKCEKCGREFKQKSHYETHKKKKIPCVSDDKIYSKLIFEENIKYTAIDLFFGCGGMLKGLSDLGINILGGIDIWNKAIDSYKSNFDHYAICEDLQKLSPKQFSQIYNIDDIYIIVGSPPCQSFSIAGKRNINDPRS